jgi:hypothetical protein
MTSASVPLQEIIRERELLAGGEIRPEKNDPIDEYRFPCPRAGGEAGTGVNFATSDNGESSGETAAGAGEPVGAGP